MLEITLQFKSVDEAIVALGKLTGGKVAAVAAPVAEKAAVVAEKAAPPVEKTTGKRKPRNDAGKPRGPNARTLTPAEEKAIDDAAVNKADDEARAAMQAKREAAASTAESPRSPSEPPADSVEPPPQVDAEAALTAVFEQKGLVVAQEVLARFGLKRLKDILPDQRAGFIAAAKEVLEGAQP